MAEKARAPLAESVLQVSPIEFPRAERDGVEARCKGRGSQAASDDSLAALTKNPRNSVVTMFVVVYAVVPGLLMPITAALMVVVAFLISLRVATIMDYTIMDYLTIVHHAP
jgi:hypothetical protein